MVKDFFIRFITYYSIDGNVTSYSDSLGEGSFGWRHILWMGVIIAFAVIGFRYFKKHQIAERKVVLFLLFALLTVRLTNQTVRAILGVEVPWTQAFPFHMCTVMTFLMPLTYIFRWEKIKTPVYVLAMMGGIITVLMGEYFDSQFMNFFTLEGMSAHTILILVPIYEIAAGQFQLDIKSSWKVIVGILVLMGWATLANLVFFVGTDPNYMYLLHNALPFGNDQNYFFIYIIIFIGFFTIIYGSPILYRKLAHQQ